MTAITVFSAFLVGLLGGVHCAAMCGGIVSAISWRSVPGTARPVSTAARSLYHLAYSTGRIGSYTLAGFVAGWLGSGALLFEQFLPVRTVLYVLASLMLLAQGLYLAGIWRGVTYLERAGGRIWRHVQPLTRRLVPIDSARKALALGVLWGWLPCGMVYSVLATALASGHPVGGALTMLAFGLGTLPNLLAMGFAAERVRPLLKHVRVRTVAGVLMMGFGVVGLVRAAQPAHDHSAAVTMDRSDEHKSPGHVRADR